MMRLDQNRAFWERVKIPAGLDLVEVLPANLPKSRRFETKADVVKRSIEREQRLRKTCNDHVAEFLADCRSGQSRVASRSVRSVGDCFDDGSPQISWRSIRI